MRASLNQNSAVGKVATLRAGEPDFDSWRRQCLLQRMVQGPHRLRDTPAQGHTSSGTHRLRGTPAQGHTQHAWWSSVALPTACRTAEVKNKWSCASVTARVVVACCRSALPLYLTVVWGYKQFETWSKIHRILCSDLAPSNIPFTSAFSQIFWRQQAHCYLLLSVL